MTNTVFTTIHTQYIIDFSSASSIAKHWDLPNTEISSLKILLQYSGNPEANEKRRFVYAIAPKDWSLEYCNPNSSDVVRNIKNKCFFCFF
jgi:hypothetical protein